MMSKHLLSFLCASTFVAPASLAEDWPMWGGDATRNMVAHEESPIPIDFAPGELVGRSDAVDPATTKHVKWIAKLGSQAYGNPVVAQGKVFVGTNNESPRDDKYQGDRSVLLCLDENTGDMIWQLNVPKSGAGKVGDWEFLGICSSPNVQGDRVYLVTNLCDVVCLDINGMANGNDGPFTEESEYLARGGGPIEMSATDADVIWRFDMGEELLVFPHNITSNSPLVVDDKVFVATSNGVDWSHTNIPYPNAPAMIAVSCETGELAGEEGAHISQKLLHCNWSSPTYMDVDGEETIVFGGGDGTLYGFDPAAQPDEADYLIFPTRWSIDGNPPEYRTDPEGNPIKYATPKGPSEFISTPVVYDGLIYAAIGQDPEHGDGIGALSCVDPSQVDESGNAKLVWRSTEVSRQIATVSVHEGLVYAADYAGVVHCLDAKTGEKKWEHDTLAHIWGSTLVADGKVLVGNEDGILTILQAGPEKKVLAEIEFPGPIYSTPVLANGPLYVATMSHLFAISPE